MGRFGQYLQLPVLKSTTVGESRSPQPGFRQWPCKMIASLMSSLSRNAVPALIGITLVLHTAEEYVAFPRFLSAPSRLPSCLPPPRLLQNHCDIHVALVIATVLPLGVIAWAIPRTDWQCVRVAHYRHRKGVGVMKALGTCVVAGLPASQSEPRTCKAFSGLHSARAPFAIVSDSGCATGGSGVWL